MLTHDERTTLEVRAVVRSIRLARGVGALPALDAEITNPILRRVLDEAREQEASPGSVYSEQRLYERNRELLAASASLQLVRKEGQAR
jgi:hypothetical protein